MSGYLAGKVWHSALHPDLKPLAATLADIGDDDGTSIYPSIAFVAWRLGRSHRAIERGLRQLRQIGVLAVIVPGGGRNRPTEYQLVESKLPTRDPWPATRNPGIKRGVSRRQNPGVDVAKPRRLRHETPAPTTCETLGPVRNNPPVVPSRGDVTRFTFQRQVIEVELGRHKRLPSFDSAGMRAEDVAALLTRRGFPARVVDGTASGLWVDGVNERPNA